MTARRFSAVEYAQEGDQEMYSFEALEARQGLRCERQIKLGLQRIYSVFPMKVKDELGNKMIISEDYIAFEMRVIKTLFAPGEFSLQKARQTAIADWKKDSAGEEYMSQQQFYDALFELVDHWTVSTEKEDYAKLLHALYSRVSIVGADGGVSFMNLREVDSMHPAATAAAAIQAVGTKLVPPHIVECKSKGRTAVSERRARESARKRNAPRSPESIGRACCPSLTRSTLLCATHLQYSHLLTANLQCASSGERLLGTPSCTGHLRLSSLLPTMLPPSHHGRLDHSCHSRQAALGGWRGGGDNGWAIVLWSTLPLSHG
jgi:hypothetical protein